MSVKKITENIALSEGAIPLGCKVEGGKIVKTLQPSAADPSCPADIVFAEYSDGIGRFFAMTEDGWLYTSLGGMYYIQVYEMPGELPFLVNQRDENGLFANFVCGGLNLFHRGPENRVIRTFDYPVGGCVYKNGRFFGIDLNDRRKIRWSGTKKLTDWEEGIYGAGWLYTEQHVGNVLKLIVYGDYLLAVCEYGITKISAYGAPENFKVLSSDLRTAAIVKDTFAIVGEKAFFYTAAGLFAYDGKDAERVKNPILEGFESLDFAVSYSGEYYASGYNNALGKRCIICLDPSTGNAFLIDCPAHALCAHDGVYAYTDGGVCKLQESAKWQFTSGKINFGTGERKALKRVEIFADGGAEISVESESEKRAIKSPKTPWLPHICGRIFEFTVKSGAEKLQISATAEKSD